MKHDKHILHHHQFTSSTRTSH